MIVEILLSIVVGIMVTLDELLPDLEIPGVGEVVGSLMSGLFVLSGYVPLADLFAGLALILGARFVMAFWHIIVWIYHQFWGSS